MRETEFVAPGLTGPVYALGVVAMAPALDPACTGAGSGGLAGKSVCVTGATVVYGTIGLVCTMVDWRDAGHWTTFERQEVIVYVTVDIIVVVSSMVLDAVGDAIAALTELTAATGQRVVVV